MTKYVVYRKDTRRFVQRNGETYGSLRLAKVYKDTKWAESQMIAVHEILIPLEEAEGMTKHKGRYYHPDEVHSICISGGV